MKYSNYAISKSIHLDITEKLPVSSTFEDFNGNAALYDKTIKLTVKHIFRMGKNVKHIIRMGRNCETYF